MVINSKPNSRIANLSFSHTSTTTTAANGNTVVGYQLGLSFNDINLQSGTLYYYYIYAANSICTGGPKYFTTPLANLRGVLIISVLIYRLLFVSLHSINTI